MDMYKHGGDMTMYKPRFRKAIRFVERTNDVLFWGVVVVTVITGLAIIFIK